MERETSLLSHLLSHPHTQGQNKSGHFTVFCGAETKPKHLQPLDWFRTVPSKVLNPSQLLVEMAWPHMQHQICDSDTARERTVYKAAGLGWFYNDKHTLSYWTVCFPPSSWCYHYFLNPACQTCSVNNPPVLSRAKVAQQLSDLPAACQERKSQLSGEPNRGNWIAHWGQG